MYNGDSITLRIRRNQHIFPSDRILHMSLCVSLLPATHSLVPFICSLLRSTATFLSINNKIASLVLFFLHLLLSASPCSARLSIHRAHYAICLAESKELIAVGTKCERKVVVAEAAFMFRLGEEAHQDVNKMLVNRHTTYVAHTTATPRMLRTESRSRSHSRSIFTHELL